MDQEEGETSHLTTLQHQTTDTLVDATTSQRSIPQGEETPFQLMEDVNHDRTRSVGPAKAAPQLVIE